MADTSSVPMPSTSTAPPSPTAAEFTALHRVFAIPLIAASIDKLNEVLATNAYTSSSYSTAKGFSTSAYKYAEPLQQRLAPLIVQADGLANKGLDVVEARYPYPFKAQPEDVANFVRERRQSATEYVRTRRDSAVTGVNKTLDERVRSPALHVVQEIDGRFAPIVDYIEARLNAEIGAAKDATPPSPTTEAKYQYQRALALTKALTDHISVYSTEQLKQLQAQSVLVQKATETAQSLSAAASSSVTSVQTRVHGLSDTLAQQLQKLQETTAALSASLHDSTAQIQPHLRQTYADLSANLTATAAELRETITAKDVPLQEKARKVGEQVRERVTPLLENVKKGITEVVTRTQQKTAETAAAVNSTNGSAEAK
ncbi:uncharacterized protein SCHCODRAFT_02620155 [Schizophyllum commune H4-8]|nr:uncharacterized protein SCHCODRAFT_02620155 [Schizophyllum commune H4-8]KAI5895701.1 hypothetical protein SCHCODRAFT_02620155 [Schizophyllum commune H4-8]